VIFILADGLSARAVHEHGVALLVSTVAQLRDVDVGMPVLARQARVAIGDEIALLTGAQLVVVLIGERPGLSSANSLSAYTTYAPQSGLPDSRRNCISNVREDAGLSVAAASAQLARLIQASLEQRLSGIGLDLEPTPSAYRSLDVEHGQSHGTATKTTSETRSPADDSGD
jgi:ethanolamine ammonia-lyase small subunit